MTRARALALALLVVLAPAAAAAHHVGTYTPRDNEVTTNFKQVKFSVQAKKFDVALRLFDQGALGKEMRAQAARLPAGIEEATRAALKTGDAHEVERLLMLLFLALSRDLTAEAERRVGAPGASVESRAATGRKFLEAIWRYYNLVDFAVTQRDPKAAAAMRLAFDDAEGYVKGTAAPAAANPCSGPKPPSTQALNPDKMRESLRQIARILTGVIEAFAMPARRSS